MGKIELLQEQEGPMCPLEVFELLTIGIIGHKVRWLLEDMLLNEIFLKHRIKMYLRLASTYFCGQQVSPLSVDEDFVSILSLLNLASDVLIKENPQNPMQVVLEFRGEKFFYIGSTLYKELLSLQCFAREEKASHASM